MNALLEHVWGESPAVDRVWAQVTGMSPRRAVGCPLMVLQAFIDDSYTPGGAFVLAGYIATAETWAQFSQEWEETLPHGVRTPEGGFHFKLSEMTSNPERLARVEWFYRIIENHDLLPVAATLNISDLRRAVSRIWSLKMPLYADAMSNQFIMTYRLLMDMFHANRDQMTAFFPADAPVDFIFDRQQEKRVILGEWDNYIERRPQEYKQLYGAAPRFEDDRKFLPLQAADLWAGSIRHWLDRGRPPKVEGMVLGRWRSFKPGRKMMLIEAGEDQLASILLEMLKTAYPGGPFYDSAAARP